MNPQLLEYIRNERARGVADIDIRNALVSAGWAQSDVEQAFRPAQPRQQAYPRPAAEPQPSPSLAGRYQLAVAKTERTSHLGFMIAIAAVVLIAAAGYLWFDDVMGLLAGGGSQAARDAQAKEYVMKLRLESVGYFSANSQSYKGFCSSPKASEMLTGLVRAAGGDRFNVRCTDADGEFAISAAMPGSRFICIDSLRAEPTMDVPALHFLNSCNPRSASATPAPQKAASASSLTDEQRIANLIKNTLNTEKKASTTADLVAKAARYYIPAVRESVEGEMAKLSGLKKAMNASLPSLSLIYPNDIKDLEPDVAVEEDVATSTFSVELEKGRRAAWTIVAYKESGSWLIGSETVRLEQGSTSTAQVTGFAAAPILTLDLSRSLDARLVSALSDLRALLASRYNDRYFPDLKNPATVPSLALIMATSSAWQAAMARISALKPDDADLAIFSGGKAGQFATSYSIYAPLNSGGYYCLAFDGRHKESADPASAIPEKVGSAAKCE